MVNFMLVTLFLMFVKVMPSIEAELPNDLLDWRPIEERTSIRSKWGKWTHGYVPYHFDEAFTEENRTLIRNAMKEIERHSCVRFYEQGDNSILKPKSYLYIVNHTSCWSEDGYMGGREQRLSLKIPDCLKTGIILHQLLHTLGLLNEHQRPDRDEYVTVNLWNVRDGNKGDFEVLDVDSQGLPYDYRSVMHYYSELYAENTSIPTIKPNPQTQCNINVIVEEDLGHGLKNGYLTELDVQKINKFYECCDEVKS